METIPLYNVYDCKCPTRTVLSLIADKWTVLIIGALEDGPQRFSELQRSITGVTQKMLTQTLRHLERDGIINRMVYPVIPPHVEYELTELGRTLVAPIAAIRDWAEDHIGEIFIAREQYDAQTKRSGGK